MRSSPDEHLWGVVLAGGIGSRFWPASTPGRPKQLLRLASEKPLIHDTVARIDPLIPSERLRILTGEHLVGPISRTLPRLDEENFFVEPRAAGTGPILAWAAVQIAARDPDAVMVSLHADHVISPPDAFRDRIRLAAELATRHRRLFTLGAVPTRPETQYGYIQVGPPLVGESGGHEVQRFVEKPDARTAAELLDHGDYLWNTGIFIWRAADLLDQLDRHTPEIARLIPLARAGDIDAFFARVPALSIDEGLLERSDRIGVLPADFRWDDVGGWDAIFRTQPHDADGNVIVGEGHAVESTGSALYADDGPIVAFGVDDLVIVRTAGATFVTRRERASELKSLLAELPDHLRTLE